MIDLWLSRRTEIRALIGNLERLHSSTPLSNCLTFLPTMLATPTEEQLKQLISGPTDVEWRSVNRVFLFS